MTSLSDNPQRQRALEMPGQAGKRALGGLGLGGSVRGQQQGVMVRSGLVDQGFQPQRRAGQAGDVERRRAQQQILDATVAATADQQQIGIDSTGAFAIGYEYRIQRPLRVYVNYAFVTNDDNANLNPWNQARRTGQPGSFGDTASGLSLGLRYDF